MVQNLSFYPFYCCPKSKSSTSLSRLIARAFFLPFSALQTAQCYWSIVHRAPLFRILYSFSLYQIFLFVPRDSASTLLYAAHVPGGWHCGLQHWVPLPWLSTHSFPQPRRERRLQWVAEWGWGAPQQPPRQFAGWVYPSVKVRSSLWVSLSSCCPH